MDPDRTVSAPWLPSGAEGANRLLIVYSPSCGELGRALVLKDEAVHIGRAEEGPSTFTLDDDKTSRRHAVVERDPDRAGYRIGDLGSRNGTHLDARRIEAAPLVDGSVVRIGSHLLLFQSLDHEACQRQFDPSRATSTLIGGSHRLLRVHSQILSMAPEPYPVLIMGESGVGKELVARAIHDTSRRVGRFVAVNCAALPEQLVESELFGHARGAFTGAASRPGLFREAERGTLFLDEIGQLREHVQAKLLRALETQEVRAVGDDRSQVVDVRIVAATNLDVEKAVEEGKFRGDLYARLMAAVIRVPALRERRDDVVKLAQHFLSAAGHPGDITPDAAEALLLYSWPFNVRELGHVIRAAAAVADGEPALDLKHLPARLQALLEARHSGRKAPPSVPSPLLSIRRDVPPTTDELKEVLALSEGNVARVAAFFLKDRRQIYRWADRLGVDLSTYREEASAAEGEPSPESPRNATDPEE